MSNLVAHNHLVTNTLLSKATACKEYRHTMLTSPSHMQLLALMEGGKKCENVVTFLPWLLSCKINSRL